MELSLLLAALENKHTQKYIHYLSAPTVVLMRRRASLFSQVQQKMAEGSS